MDSSVSYFRIAAFL